MLLDGFTLMTTFVQYALFASFLLMRERLNRLLLIIRSNLDLPPKRLFA